LRLYIVQRVIHGAHFTTLARLPVLQYMALRWPIFHF
jgi:hypothetical protein